jgi:alkanesulfonate monooxygenase SsuD/methylene tetrahydromethanopterin reductase-like flavin-dependent oxidoreductase (luciferase family)
MTFDTIVARALAAEAAGFDSIWLMDHLAAPMTPELDTFEGWTVAAALAARTERIRIGHLVTCDPFRHPALLAKMVATVDHISGGRIELGIGWGSVDAELDMFGIGRGTAKERAERLAESLEILDLMFSGEPFDFEGTWFRMQAAMGRPRPLQRPRPPVHIGGAGPKLTMPLVQAHADWWNCPSYAVERLDEIRPLAGDARVSLQRPVALAPDAASRDETVATGERRFGSWGGLVGGTSAEVAEALRRDIGRGVEGFVLQFTDFGMPATLEQFMEEVAPELHT